MDAQNQKLLEETNEFMNIRDAEEYADKVPFIGQAWADLQKMVEQYYEWSCKEESRAQMASAIKALRGEILKQKKKVAAEIEKVQRAEEDELIREYQKATTEKQISISQSANVIASEASLLAKSASKMSTESLAAAEEASKNAEHSLKTVRNAYIVAGVAILIALGAVALNFLKKEDHSALISEEINRRLDDNFRSQMASDIQSRIQATSLKKEEITAEINRQVDLKLKQAAKAKPAVKDSAKKETAKKEIAKKAIATKPRERKPAVKQKKEPRRIKIPMDS